MMRNTPLIRSWKRIVFTVAIASMGLDAHANPSGATVVHGSANINSSGNTLTVTNTPGTVINWQQFNIGQNEVTRFIQQSSSSSVLNRVTGGNLSQIHGQLQSNGQVYLVNPHGIIFGQSAVIDTAGLIATTLNISNHDFLDGKLRFHDLANSAEILNQGFIHTSNEGEVMLIAPTVTNEGTIEVEQGNITLVAGKSVTIDSLNHDAISFEVQAPEDTAVNLGELMSDGGSIGVFAGSIRNEGVVSANAITVDDAGVIRFVAQTDNVQLDATVSAVGTNGQGGEIDVLGDRVGVFGDTLIDASGRSGGGTVHVGGEYQGRGDKPTATTTQVSEDAQVRADAIVSGNGGEVIVWADDTTLFSGTTTTDGGPRFGDGGFIEISGKISLGFDGFARAGSYLGTAGTVLFDPRDVTITFGLDPVGQLPSSNIVPNDLLDFADLGGNDQIVPELSPLAITNITDTGTAVELRVNRDLFINDPIVTTASGSGGDITLRAGRSIFINANITTDSGLLSLTANDPSASSVDRGTGNAVIQQQAGTTIDTGFGNFEVTMSSGFDNTNDIGNNGDDITLGNVTAQDIIFRQKSNTDLSDILQLSGTTIVADSLFIDHQFTHGGAIGSPSVPLNLQVNAIGAHIHEATDGGIDMVITDNGAGTVAVGDTCYGNGATGCGTFGSHFRRGIHTDIDTTGGGFTSGGYVDVDFINTNMINFDGDDGNEYGITSEGSFLDVQVPNGFLTSDAQIVEGTDGGGLTIGATTLSSFDIIESQGISSVTLTSTGPVTLSNTSGSPISISAYSDVSITGTAIQIVGGTSATESVGISSGVDGTVSLNATAGGINITSGSADQTGVLIDGVSAGAADVKLSATGNLILQAATGTNSSVEIRSNDSDTTGIEINAANLSFINATAGTDSDVFLNASSGMTEVALTLSGTCSAPCNNINDPTIIAGSQTGIWASNFPAVVATLYTWIGGDGWDDGAAWDLGSAPGAGDDALIANDSVGITTGNFAINNLTLTNSTLSIGSSSGLTIAGLADLDATSTLQVNTGGTLTTSASSRLQILGTLNINGGTAVINGLNNTLNTLLLSGSSGQLLGTGSSTANGTITWNEAVVAHDLTATAGITIDSATFNARQTGGTITIANAAAGQRIDGSFDITGSGRFVNNGTLSLEESGSVRSTDGTGIFESAGGSMTNNSTSVTFNIGNNTDLSFIVSGGTVDGADGGIRVDTNTTPMQWDGGTLTAGFGGFDINTDLTIGGDAIKTLDSITLSVDNPVSINGQGDLDIINGGVFTIVSGGTTTHSSDANIISSTTGNLGTFQIQGDTFTKNNRSTEVTALFNNNFAVDISSNGTLILNVPIVQDDNPSSYTMSGNGRLEIASDRDFTNGGFNFTAGTFAVTNDANVNIGTSGGVLSSFHNLEINNPTPSNGIFSEDNVTIGGTFDWLGGTLQLTGFNVPSFTLESTGILNLSVPNVSLDSNNVVDGIVNINNGGELIFTTASPATFNGIFNINSGGAIDIQSGSTTLTNGINGDGTLKINTAGAVLTLGALSTAGDLQMSDGTLQGSSLILSGLSDVSGGTIQLDSLEKIDFAGGVDFSNSVTFGNAVAVSSGTTFGTTTLLDDGSGLFTFTVNASNNVVITDPDDDFGPQLRPVTSAEAFIIDGTTFIQPGVTVDGGEINVASAATLDVGGAGSIGLINQNDGTISGIGTIIGDVTNDANIDPGTSPGILTIDGNLLLGVNSVVNLDLLGTTSQGTDYDLLQIIDGDALDGVDKGNVTLGGVINIVTQQGSTNVAVADGFTPITYLASTGPSTLQITNNEGYGFDLEFGPTGAEVQVLSLPGQSGLVDPIGTDANNLIDTVENNDYFVEDVEAFYEVGPLEEEEEEKQGTLICS